MEKKYFIIALFCLIMFLTNTFAVSTLIIDTRITGTGNSAPSSFGTTTPTGTTAYQSDKISIVTLTAIPNNGFKFDGWSSQDRIMCYFENLSSSSFKNPDYLTFDGRSSSTNLNPSCTVIANFSQITYSLIVVSSSPSYGSVSNSASNVSAGSVRTVTAFPNTANQIVVSGWTSSDNVKCPISNVSSDKTTASVTVNGNCTVTANFVSTAPTRYSLTVFGSPASGGSASGSASGISAGTVKNVSAIPAANYIVSGWSSSDTVKCPISNISADKKTASVTVNGDCTVIANFSATGYSLTVTAGSGGTATGSTSNVAAGTVKTITATPNSGYAFNSWLSSSGSCTVANVSSTSTTVTVNANCTINASFSANPTTYNLTVSAGSGGTATGSASNVSAGSSKTITATPNSGYTFSNWSNSSSTSCTVANSSAFSTNVTVNGNCTVTANFAAIANNYNLTVQSNNSSYGSVSPSGVSARTVGEIVSLTATPVQSDIGVLSWISSSNNCVISNVSTEKTIAKVTVNGNCIVTANFYSIYGAQFVLQVESNNASYGKTSPTANSLRKAHEVVNLAATPTNSSYKFDNWKTTDTLSCPILDAKSATTSVTVKTNCTITANFSQAGSSSLCGNSLIDSGEDCDGINLNGKDCSNLNYRVGCDGRGACSNLNCNSSCKFDTSSCLGGNLTVQSSDISYGTVTGSVSNAKFETNLPINAVPNAGYKFDSWALKYTPWVSVESSTVASTNAQLHAVNGRYNGTVEAAFVSCSASDPDCAKAEICDNSIDDDGDGKIDCLDSDCARASNCIRSRRRPGAPTISIVKSG